MPDNAHEFYVTGRDYDLVSSHGVPGDVEYFVRLARKARRVLELGCGTGRITFTMLKEGARVTGLDLVPAMLDAATSKAERLDAKSRQRLRLLRGDMRSFDLGEEFPLIVIPFRAFQHLLTHEDQRACLECCCKHLTPGGRLVINIFDPNLRIIANQMLPGLPGPVIKTEVAEEDGQRLIVWTSRSISPENQILREEWVLERFDADGNSISRRLHRLTLRWSYRFEMEHLFELCGLKVIKLEGGFAGQAYAHGGEQIWTVARIA